MLHILQAILLIHILVICDLLLEFILSKINKTEANKNETRSVTCRYLYLQAYNEIMNNLILRVKVVSDHNFCKTNNCIYHKGMCINKF